MASLDELITNYRQTYDERQGEIATLKARLTELETPLQTLESLIKAAVIERGESVEHLGVKATYRSGYTRVNWDGKALEGYAAAHPELLAFRSESAVKPTASIKVS